MITMTELMMIRQAVSTVALEKDLNKDQEQELFNEAVAEIIKSRTKVSKKKRHKQ